MNARRSSLPTSIADRLVLLQLQPRMSLLLPYPYAQERHMRHNPPKPTQSFTTRPLPHFYGPACGPHLCPLAHPQKRTSAFLRSQSDVRLAPTKRPALDQDHRSRSPSWKPDRGRVPVHMRTGYPQMPALCQRLVGRRPARNAQADDLCALHRTLVREKARFADSSPPL